MLRSTLINTIIEKYKIVNPDYLEIGVWTGETFKHIHSTSKDGVDPGQYCESSYVNYKMTSDEFFSKHVEKKYDIVFIDGLHTAYQVTKDIYNAIRHLKKGGWIILDDVFPHSEYEQERLNLQKSGPQTGDVWKALYHILDTIHDMSDVMYFESSTERGNFIFKLKYDNHKNIDIDDTIPTNNVDGWYTGDDSEWNKYSYKKDFQDYMLKLNKINEASSFMR
jgi:hypothetical protein